MPVLAAVLLIAGVVMGACNRNNACNNCQDIVSTIPWSGAERHAYQLKDSSSDKGTAVFSIAPDGANTLFTQSFSDDKGNTDESVVTVHGDTLKPITSNRTIIDSTLRNVVEATYESVSKDQCSDEMIVRIKQTTYKPPDADKSSSERSNPLCVPLHSYDNDSSLFIWRTIKFEKGYVVTYKTVLANRRDTQVVTLEVRDMVAVDVPAGHFDTWLVYIEADRRTQQAWFATTPDHTLIRYNNDTLDFLLTK